MIGIDWVHPASHDAIMNSEDWYWYPPTKNEQIIILLPVGVIPPIYIYI